jgi:hypothetical protein
MTDIIKAALFPEDRLGAGSLVYVGKKSEHVAEYVHLLTIALHRQIELLSGGQPGAF